MTDNIYKDDVTDFEQLYISALKCRKGVMWKGSVASFILNGIEKVNRLSEDLNTGKYKAKPPVFFKITSPKPREIASIAFRDRVFQRCLNDNIVYPIMTNSFIYDNYACQKGKGTDKARNRLKEFLRKYYRKNGNIGYVLQVDIKGYYPNMSHEMCESTFKKKLPEKYFRMVQTILREQYQGDKGYNAGSQLVQIAGISVLDGLDHFVKEKLHIKFYLRYMDDFIIIHHDKSYLEYCMTEIKKYLDTLKFTLNEKKTKIYTIVSGIEFLGFNFKLTDTGKVLMLIKSSNVKAERKKLYRLVKKSKQGFMPKHKVDESYHAWRNHASKGNNYNLIIRMDKFYKNLWR